VRIAFFGLPLAAWLLHRDGHDVVYAGLSRATPGSRRVTRVLRHVETRPDVNARATVDRVRALSPDLVVSWFWTTRLPMEIVAAAPLGAFGVHPSLLPRHRGPDPYFWAIDSGDTVTGVTAHRIAEDYDTGEILARRELPIDPTWSAWTLARALDRPSLALLRELAGAYANGTPPVPHAQDESMATLAPAPSDEELEIDWTWPSARIARRIRAASPSPGAWSFFGDEGVTITGATVADAHEFPRALAPGEAWAPPEPSGRAIVRTGDGALVLLSGRMDAAEDEPPHELDAADLADMVRALGG
jgi:methionyl-tRNA formyltransferase